MDQDKLVELVTKTIMERLAASGDRGSAQPGVVTFGKVPAGVLAPGVASRQGSGPSDVEGSQVIVMTIEAFRAFHGGSPLPTPAAAGTGAAAAATAGSGEVDLRGRKLVSEVDVRRCDAGAGCVVRVDARAILTALARDYANANGITIARA